MASGLIKADGAPNTWLKIELLVRGCCEVLCKCAVSAWKLLMEESIWMGGGLRFFLAEEDFEVCTAEGPLRWLEVWSVFCVTVGEHTRGFVEEVGRSRPTSGERFEERLTLKGIEGSGKLCIV